MKIGVVAEHLPRGSSVISGGRYHCVLVAAGLCELDHEVTLITDHKPSFWEDLARYYKMPKVRINRYLSKLSKEDGNYDLIISYPILASRWGLSFAQKLGVPCWAFILDPENLCKKHAPDVASRMHYSQDHTDSLRDSDLLLSISKYAVPFIKKWTGNEKVVPLMACVNSRCADEVSVQAEAKRFVVITRLTKHKRLSDTIYCSRELGIKIDLITSHQSQQIITKVREAGLDDRISVHSSPDDRTKFWLIKRARAGLGASVYEGLGMPFMEYVYCGTPVACYNYPVLKEVCGDGALYARPASPESLANQVKGILDDHRFQNLFVAAMEKGKEYSFKAMVARLETVLEKWL